MVVVIGGWGNTSGDQWSVDFILTFPFFNQYHSSELWGPSPRCDKKHVGRWCQETVSRSSGGESPRVTRESWSNLVSPLSPHVIKKKKFWGVFTVPWGWESGLHLCCQLQRGQCRSDWGHVPICSHWESQHRRGLHGPHQQRPEKNEGSGSITDWPSTSEEHLCPRLSRSRLGGRCAGG